MSKSKKNIKDFVKNNLSKIKAFCLFLITLYSVLIFIFNIQYYRYNVKEQFLFPKINFGIDIVGGNQLTIEVDTKEIINEQRLNQNDTLKAICNDLSIKCTITNDNNEKNTIQIDKKNKREDKKIIQYFRNALPYNVISVEDNKDKIKLSIGTQKKKEEQLISNATDKAISVLKSRIDGVGVKEISVQRYGMDKIVVLIPNGVDINNIKKIVNTTAKLNFHIMEQHHMFYQKPKEIMKNHILLHSYDKNNHILYLVETNPVLSGEYITEVHPVMDGISNSIAFRMNSIGAKKFADITKSNIGKLLAIVLDGKVLMSPMINIPIIGGSGTITGKFTNDEVKELSVLLRSGSLPAKITIISERQISSMFDANILSTAFYTILVCFSIIAIIMFVRYRILGNIALLSLLLNFLFTFSIISIFGFTLTLPGIAGFVLMLGMATDANILIYEKMKELKKQGVKQKDTIIKNGFSKAIGIILDSNITTIIAGIALFSFGGSFIKGFSITLIFGIFCSIFTAVNITKMIINIIYKNKQTINV